jgi:hypothetical protein
LLIIAFLLTVVVSQAVEGFIMSSECAISHGLISGAYKLTHKSVSKEIIII